MKVLSYLLVSFLGWNIVQANIDAQDLNIADCPVAVTSFGAAVCENHLYVYGGNQGVSHGFSSEGQNNIFRRVKLENGAEWEELGEVPSRQGNALVSHNGKIYRIGGFEAKNKAGEEQNIVSTADFEMFDPERSEWIKLNDLPETRSSFDAVVVDDTVFIVGGWSLNGKDEETKWLETAWKFDLGDPKGNWQSIKNPPFIRRANSVSFSGDKVYVIGGMGEQGGSITCEVAVYDSKKDSWSEGPKVPGDNMQGFGTSSFNVGGHLIVSTANGQVLQLNDDGSEWTKIHELEAGRFFHRLVGIDDHRFVVVGGTGGSAGKFNDVVVCDLTRWAEENAK